MRIMYLRTAHTQISLWAPTVYSLYFLPADFVVSEHGVCEQQKLRSEQRMRMSITGLAVSMYSKTHFVWYGSHIPNAHDIVDRRLKSFGVYTQFDELCDQGFQTSAGIHDNPWFLQSMRSVIPLEPLSRCCSNERAQRMHEKRTLSQHNISE